MNSASPSSSLTIPAPDGTTLHVIVRQADPGAVPFLLVHGLASNARLWDGVGERLAAGGHPSVAVDQRGHGESGKVDHGFDFPTLVDDLAAVVAGSVGGPVIAAGQSWGGNVVLELAAQRPDVVAGVVCVDGGFIKISSVFDDWRAAELALAPPSMAGTTRTDLRELLRSGLAGFSDRGIDAQLANFEDLPDGTVRSRLSRDRHMTILRFLWEHDPDALSARVRQPVLVIATEGGFADKDRRVDEFAQGLDRGSVVWMDAHHDVHAQHPDSVGELMIRFAQRIGGEAS